MNEFFKVQLGRKEITGIKTIPLLPVVITAIVFMSVGEKILNLGERLFLVMFLGIPTLAGVGIVYVLATHHQLGLGLFVGFMFFGMQCLMLTDFLAQEMNK